MTVPRRWRLLALATALLAVPLALPSTAADPVLVPVSAGATTTLGHDRLGVRRGDVWHLNDALVGGRSRAYREGLQGWLPVAGDTDGSGDDSVSLFRDGLWALRDQEGGIPRLVPFGMPGDQPLLGDWDGDGTDTLAVYRAGRFVLRDGNGPTATTRAVGFGVPGDVAAVGDWDGDGDTDLGVRRGLSWYQRDASTPGPASRRIDWGAPGDVPVAGDWDHDGRDTPGLFRSGRWFFRGSDGTTQSTAYGSPGDVPVLRRTRSLAPGVVHRVLRNPSAPYTAHVVTVALSAASSPDVVLAGDRLGTLETVTSMARRTGAVLAVNGDYHSGDGRPVHLFASDGALVQTPQLLGRAIGIDASGGSVSMGHPDVRVSVTSGALSADVTQVNSGAPSGGSVSAYTPVGRSAVRPPDGACYATTTSGPRSVSGGSVRTPLTVTSAQCGGPAPGGSVLAMSGDPAASAFLRSLRPGSRLVQTAQLGFPGAVDVIGGNPLLVDRGAVVSPDVDGTDAFSRRNPRTAVGVTRDGKLLVVVVDGRQGSYSSGASLRELADLMRTLGSVQAVNLDGGGSTELVLNGVIVNRPSDGRERPVSSALVVLPGADGNQASLTAPPAAATGDRLLSPAATDPGSTGGLLDALRRDGVDLPAALRATADAFARSR